MPLTFRGTPIPGLHGRPKFGPWGVQLTRTTYFGLEGESEIRGERTGRDIVMESVFYNSFVSGEQLENAIETLNKNVPTNGKIVQTGAINRTLQRCTFEGITMKGSPLPDNKIGWWVEVEIRWRQLGP
ncbi:MAG: hypothetical protein V4719_26605 [Planctomycetota bacterium]